MDVEPDLGVSFSRTASILPSGSLKFVNFSIYNLLITILKVFQLSPALKNHFIETITMISVMKGRIENI